MLDWISDSDGLLLLIFLKTENYILHKFFFCLCGSLKMRNSKEAYQQVRQDLINAKWSCAKTGFPAKI